MNERCGRCDPCLLIAVLSVLLGILTGVAYFFGYLPAFASILPYVFAAVLFGFGLFLALFIAASRKRNCDEAEGGVRWRSLVCLCRYWECLLAGTLLSLGLILINLAVASVNPITILVFVVLISSALWLFTISLVAAIACVFCSTCRPGL